MHILTFTRLFIATTGSSAVKGDTGCEQPSSHPPRETSEDFISWLRKNGISDNDCKILTGTV